MSDDEATRFLDEHDHYREDLPFWRAAAARLGDPVLDVGAAAGRVALDLARAGHAVWAVDSSDAMLAALRRAAEGEDPEVRRRITAARGDMRTLDLGRTFPLVVVAMNTLQVLTAPADRAAGVRAVADHVAPGGELLFDVAMPDTEEIRGSIGVERGGGSHRLADGTTLVHSAWYDEWDAATQTLRFTLRVRSRAPGGPWRQTLRRHRVHLFTPGEVSALVAEAGLEHVAVHGDFAGGRLRPSSERQVHRCRRAA